MADYYEIDDPSNYYSDFSGIGDISDPGNYNPYEEILRGFAPNPTGNLELDFSVNERGQVIDSAGNRGSFIDGVWTPNPDIARGTGSTDFLRGLLNRLKGAGTKAADFATSGQGIMALLAALASYKDRARPSGGGTTMAYAGPKPIQRTMTQGAYGPIARYAAQGGIMHAYAQGGAVRPFPMQDGGFVLTADAVKGAGGFDGMRQRVPEAKPIVGPGHGTSDSIPAYIQGPNGTTPAKVSNGEMYVPPGRDTRGLYALMRAMERKA